MQAIQSLYYKKQVDHILQYDVHPCTEIDIIFLETELGFTLPESYKMFLRSAGRQPYDFFGEDIIPFDFVLPTIDRAKAIIHGHGFSTSHLDHCVVIAMGSQEYSFEILRATEGDMVFQYMEGEGSIQEPFTKIADSFWSYIYERLFSQVQIQALFIPRGNEKNESCGKGNEKETELSTAETRFCLPLNSILYPLELFPFGITKDSATNIPSTGDYQHDVFNLVKQMVYLRLKQTLKPVSDAEIFKIEKKVKGRIPVIYKQFLKWGGHGLPNLLELYIWHLDDLELIQPHILNVFRNRLSPNAYVFLVYPGNEEFDIFYVNEGDDPPVYHCKKIKGELIIVKTNDTLSDYLINAINAIQ